MEDLIVRDQTTPLETAFHVYLHITFAELYLQHIKICGGKFYQQWQLTLRTLPPNRGPEISRSSPPEI